MTVTRKTKVFLFCNTFGCFDTAKGRSTGKDHDIDALTDGGEWLGDHRCSHGVCDLHDENHGWLCRELEKRFGPNNFELAWDNYDKPSPEFAAALKLGGE